jgi:hypothetical protein
MRRLPLVLLAFAAPLLAQMPGLKALEGFAAGSWTASPVGGGPAQAQCLADAGPLLTGGRPAGRCEFRPIEDGAAGAVVTFRCQGSLSGRTAIRRDASGIYTTHAQGIDNGLPFVARSEWRRAGDC